MRRKLLPEAEIEDAGLRLIYGKIPLPDPASHALPEWVFESIFTVVEGASDTHMGVGPVRELRRLSGRRVLEYSSALVVASRRTGQERVGQR
ncbi:hypothetical protein [Nocardia sp. NBC_01388]|uniref:hypothetical protein n=1 Tax=Nocardia sp. NBC_01388 TaxID=2903596 RepID=UPI003252F7E4